jgi:glycosyltransferase involved in cell wall biosynthesis
MMPSGTLEDFGSAERMVSVGKSYLAAHRRHNMTFVCNTAEQTERIVAAGLDGVTINQNCLMDDHVFKPLPGVEPIYDCVYNARLSPEKRHELAIEIDKLVLIYFYDSTSESVAAFHATHARYAAMFPQARFVNQLTSGGCEWVTGEEINKILAQSRVGLCLSQAEGAMRVAIEYLFAGLPLVETPTAGGRDYFFDKEFCITVEPHPRSVRNAVDALIARNIPRDYIRAKTLAKVEPERRRYINFVQEIIDRAGGKGQFESRFWRLTRGKSIINWQRMDEFYANIKRELRNSKAIEGRRTRRR